MEKITGTLITLNEEKNIADCIESMRKVCDEVLVIDSQSQDKTVDIARGLGARVYVQPYLGDGPQKAFGVQYAENDWILSIDADERLDDDMVDVIFGVDYSDTRIAYAFRRKNYVGNHWIRAAGFYPDYVIRLYNKNRSGYADKKAHSRVLAPKVKRLDAHLHHYTYRDYSHWMQRLDALSSRDAWALYEKGVRYSGVRPAFRGAAAFIRKFFLKAGMLQGADGFTVTLTTVIRAYMKYQKLNEMYEEKGMK